MDHGLRKTNAVLNSFLCIGEYLLFVKEEQDRKKKALLDEQKRQEKDIEGMSLAKIREEKAKQTRLKLKKQHEESRAR